jgi:hypothetical protein
VLADSLQHVHEVIRRIYVVQPAGRQQALHNADVPGAQLGPTEQPILLPIGISFQVWTNNIRHPADLGITPQFVHGCEFAVLDFAQRFKCDIETDLVA